MMTTMMASSSYPTNTKLASPYYFRRFPIEVFMVCLHKTAFTIGQGLYSQLCFSHIVQSSLVNNSKRTTWSISSISGGSGQDTPPTSNLSGSTRLLKVIQTVQMKINSRVKDLRKNLPVKVLFFLVGFYCATVFATAIGQTGDWDILSAALAMAVVEGIGAVMHRASVPMFNKIKSLVTMLNYWKAGLSMGLFLDSFKYEMDYDFELCNPFDFEIDVFSMFL